MRGTSLLLGLGLALAGGVRPGLADVVVLHSGHRIECVLQGDTDTQHIGETGFGRVEIPKAAVARIDRADAETNAALRALWEPGSPAMQAAAARRKTGRLLEARDTDFGALVFHAQEPVLVEFYADWCLPCHWQEPVLKDLAREYTGKVAFVKLDVDRNPLASQIFGIVSLPTLVLFEGGKPVDGRLGYNSAEELQQLLASAGSSE